jgi:hypothetical protein
MFSIKKIGGKWKLTVQAGLPDMSVDNIPKREKIYQITKWPQNIPNGRRIDQGAVKYTNIFHCKSIKYLPKFGFFV